MIKCAICGKKAQLKKEKSISIYEGIVVKYIEIYYECKDCDVQLQTAKMFDKSQKNFIKSFKKALKVKNNGK